MKELDEILSGVQMDFAYAEIYLNGFLSEIIKCAHYD